MFVCSDTDYCDKRQAARQGRPEVTSRSCKPKTFASASAPSRRAAKIRSELEEGEALAIVGGPGSGKTTLLNFIAGQLTPDEGSDKLPARNGALRDLVELAEAERRALMRTDWGFRPPGTPRA